MKLISARVTNFRSITDSGEFQLTPVTCLVGKNESGKTNILRCLERLNSTNPQLKRAWNDEMDWPRNAEGAADAEAPVMHLRWTLDDHDVARMEETFGPGAVTDRSVESFVSFGANVRWRASFDAHAFRSFLVTKYGLLAEEASNLGTTAPDDIAGWAERQGDNPRAKNVAAFCNAFPNKHPTERLNQLLTTLMPTFLYFGSQDKMPGKVSVEDFTNHRNQNPIRRDYQLFSMFLDFAGVKSEEFQTKTAESYFARLERAQNQITRKVFKYWTQNPTLEVKFQLQPGRPGDGAPYNSGTVFHTRIENRLHRMTVQFDERSYGFIWFFSFLVEFSQVRKTYPNVIVLLDEPGLSLHGLAQRDLLRFIDEELAPHHQVIYTTHSPFMVPPANLERVRVVEDVVRTQNGQLFSDGTKVSSDFLRVGRDTIFPLQGALGYEITQSLFVGKNSLLVEGPGDILYLHAASRALSQLGRVGLDPRWIICPAGGVSKVSAFVSLFSGNKLNLAVLTDLSTGPEGNKRELEALRKSRILEATRIFTVADFTGTSEADIEDMWGIDGFVAILNGAFGLSPKLDSARLVAALPTSTRLLKKTEEWFRSDATRPEFDHFTPASWLIQHPELLEQNAALFEPALQRFEAFFKQVNPLIS